jgi:hypothetical protein
MKQLSGYGVKDLNSLVHRVSRVPADRQRYVRQRAGRDALAVLECDCVGRGVHGVYSGIRGGIYPGKNMLSIISG